MFRLYMTAKGNIVIFNPGTAKKSTVSEITPEEFVELMIKAQSKSSRSPANMQKFMDIAIHGDSQQDYNSMGVYNVSNAAESTTTGSDH